MITAGMVLSACHVMSHMKYRNNYHEDFRWLGQENMESIIEWFSSRKVDKTTWSCPLIFTLVLINVSLGVLMALVATIISSTQFVLEEYLFSLYHCTIVEATSWIGMCGSVLGAIVLILGHITGFENVKAIFYQMGLGKRQSLALIICKKTEKVLLIYL